MQAILLPTKKGNWKEWLQAQISEICLRKRIRKNLKPVLFLCMIDKTIFQDNKEERIMGILLTEGSLFGNGLFLVIYIVAIFAFIYFVTVRPQKKEQKKQSQMLAALEVGDIVLTTSGFYGTVIDIKAL